MAISRSRELRAAAYRLNLRSQPAAALWHFEQLMVSVQAGEINLADEPDAEQLKDLYRTWLPGALGGLALNIRRAYDPGRRYYEAKIVDPEGRGDLAAMYKQVLETLLQYPLAPSATEPVLPHG